MCRVVVVAYGVVLIVALILNLSKTYILTRKSLNRQLYCAQIQGNATDKLKTRRTELNQGYRGTANCSVFTLRWDGKLRRFQLEYHLI